MIDLCIWHLLGAVVPRGWLIPHVLDCKKAGLLTQQMRFDAQKFLHVRTRSQGKKIMAAIQITANHIRNPFHLCILIVQQSSVISVYVLDHPMRSRESSELWNIRPAEQQPTTQAIQQYTTIVTPTSSATQHQTPIIRQQLRCIITS